MWFAQTSTPLPLETPNIVVEQIAQTGGTGLAAWK